MNSAIEESTRQGEALKEDWGPCAQREDRLKECEKLDMEFFPEDDRAMPERQAENKRRAEAKATQRKMRYQGPAFARKPQWGNEETAEWNMQKEEEKWEREKYIEWNNKQEEWKETEAERSDRRSRNSKANLAGREKIRVAGIKKNEER